MKFTIVAFAFLAVKALAGTGDGGYVLPGNLGSTILGTGTSGSSSSSSSFSSSSSSGNNIVVPSFPGATLSTLTVGSITGSSAT
jgi:hypothetical protein